MSTLTLSAGIMFIIRQAAATLDNETGSKNVPENELPTYVHRAVWTVSLSLATIIFSMTGLALLDESLDPPGTLRINNRYLRLLGRGVYVLVVLLIPIYEDINTEFFLGTCALLMMLLSIWEWITSTDRGGKFVEPKGLTATVRHTRLDEAVPGVAPRGLSIIRKMRNDERE
jgi:hypothetical protein